LAEAQAKLEAKEAEEHKRNAGPDKKLELYPDKPHVCCLIESTYADLESARQSKYYELMDDEGMVTLQCPLSGLSTTFRGLVEWPKVNVRVPCKNVNSFFVKINVIPEKK